MRCGIPPNISAVWKSALRKKPHECEVETAVYAHGTHFVFPEGMLKIMLPVGAGLFVRLAFQAAKKFPEACRQTRQDIDRRVSAAIHTWTSTGVNAGIGAWHSIEKGGVDHRSHYLP